MALYEIQSGVPIRHSKRTGLTQLFRQMKYQDSITIPGSQRSSVSQLAARAGIKVTTCANLDGTVTVWRVDLLTHRRTIFEDSPEDLLS